MNRILQKKTVVFSLCCLIVFCSVKCFLNARQTGREIVPLNGEWSCEPGAENTQPAGWTHSVGVPGLVDLIKPEVKWEEKKYFWYKKKIFIPNDKKHAFAFLRINQSKYGTQVWFNGKDVGNYSGCYTSSEYEITDVIRYGKDNEVIIRVGAKDVLASESAAGKDFEKASYIPGIWGDVFIILTGSVKIDSVQILPDIYRKKTENRINIRNLEKSRKDIVISVKVKEKNTGKIVSEAEKTITVSPLKKIQVKLDTVVPDTKLWSPDTPFLYNLVTVVSQGNKEQDELISTFGMREFKIKDSDFYLNGKRIFLRGSNIAFHRFLSDSERQYLVWNDGWIKKVLIDIPKEHNFNYFRNHLGQMYNKWYDIADEYGMLIHNEWAFWGITGTKKHIIEEMKQWVIDNFNHPSIIIWDALNEPNEEAKETEMIRNKVIPEVRKLDPTRPWEYADFVEEHPYIYSLGPVLNDKKFGFARSLDEIEKSSQPTILNEFLWFWLDSNGEYSSFTTSVGKRWLGFTSTREQRLAHQSFLAGELVELFRRMRVDGIAPFVYLSIDARATANWFLGDIKDLKPKPVLKALKNVFSPFGVSIELWDRHFFAGEKRTVNVYVFNDLPEGKKGVLICKIVNKKSDIFFEKKMDISVGESGMEIYPVEFVFPENEGEYDVVAELMSEEKNICFSRKIAYVFKTVEAPEKLKTKRIVIFDPDDEIYEYLKSLKLNVYRFKEVSLKSNDLLIIGEGGLADSEYLSHLDEIDRFVKDGNIMIVIEPSFGVNGEAKIKIVNDKYMLIVKRNSSFEGGYNSYVFKEKEQESSPIWDGIDDEHLKMFNGGLGGIMVSDYDIIMSRSFLEELKSNLYTTISDKAKAGLALNENIITEVTAGNGLIVLSRIQVRGRLVPSGQDGSLYGRRIDPVAQRLLINFLNVYSQREKVLTDVKNKIDYMKAHPTNAYASSVEADFKAENAFDGDKGTRWSSLFADPQWIVFDMESLKDIRKITIYWEAAYGKEYKIYVSEDMENWEQVYHEKNGDGETDEINFDVRRARYVAVSGLKRGTGWGYSIWELRVE